MVHRRKGLEEVEERVLLRLLKFCQSKEAIGPYVVEGEQVVLVYLGEQQRLARQKAFSLLLTIVEQFGLEEEFRSSFSAA